MLFTIAGRFLPLDHCCLSRGKPVWVGVSWSLLPVIFLTVVTLSVWSCCKSPGGRFMLPFKTAFHLRGPSFLSCLFITCFFHPALQWCRRDQWRLRPRVCGGVLLKQLSGSGTHPPTKGLLGRVIGNHAPRVFLRASNLTVAVITYLPSPHGKKASIGPGNEENVLVIVCAPCPLPSDLMLPLLFSTCLAF